MTTNALRGSRGGGRRQRGGRRIALWSHLWATGRRVYSRSIRERSDRARSIGGTGIDVVAMDRALWIPVRSRSVDRSGFPTMTAVRRVTAAGRVTTVATARGRVDVHGLAVGLGSVWVADNTGGFLYRLPR
jgi:hypothetical protein